MKYTYLLIDILTILVPLVFSFHPGLHFNRMWKYFFPATLIAALFFIAWDMYFTHIGIWGFNKKYVTGFNIGNLPFEEILFFICVPYSCVFTFFCLSSLLKNGLSGAAAKYLTWFFIVSSLVLAAIGHEHIYTLFAFSLLCVLLVLCQFVFKVRWLGQFYLTYIVLLVPFLVVNGLLTGTGLAAPVVWYNNNEIFGPRILSIPIEDVFYGMDMVLMNVMFFNYFNKRAYGF